MITIIKKDKTSEEFDVNKIITAVSKSAERIMYEFTDDEIEKIKSIATNKIEALNTNTIDISVIHKIVESTLDEVNASVAKSYREYRNYKQTFVKVLDKVFKKDQSLRYIADRENANTDSALVSTKRSLTYNYLNKELYKLFNLNVEELQACKEGYIWIHDMGARRDTMNCCLFDMSRVLKNGFEMGNLWYTEPKSLDVAFDVIGDVILSAASNQYGGFTVPEIDKILEPYATKSFTKYYDEEVDKYKLYTHKELTDGSEEEKNIIDIVTKRIERDFIQGFQGLEYKLNSVGSSRGDYPFVTLTFGLATSEFGKMANKCALINHMGGQGKKGFKRPTLFPKYVFLYDENLHGEGKELEDVFNTAIECSKRTMYPDYLSLSGDGYVASMYKKYGKVISPMGKRRSLPI